ncbi:TOBE domain-containing protein [Thalassospira lucentensis]|uniref:TOBE domain-containing protein n=1 Tax=Thalassospira lucentensis TaxID=168935 RepID=UPI003F70DA45
MNLLPGKAIGRDDIKSVGIRPEHLETHLETGKWAARVGVIENLGSDTVVYMETDDFGHVTVRLPGHHPLRTGDRVFLTPDEKHLHLFGMDGRKILAKEPLSAPAT